MKHGFVAREEASGFGADDLGNADVKGFVMCRGAGWEFVWGRGKRTGGNTGVLDGKIRYGKSGIRFAHGGIVEMLCEGGRLTKARLLQVSKRMVSERFVGGGVDESEVYELLRVGWKRGKTLVVYSP